MPIGCISRGSDAPDKITDTSSLTLTLDNAGNAILQLIILTKSSDVIAQSCYTFPFNNASFQGFISSDNPRKLEGSDYWEHAIIARGMVF